MSRYRPEAQLYTETVYNKNTTMSIKARAWGTLYTDAVYNKIQDTHTCDPPARETESIAFETLSRPPEKN
jgi:hypothetical protein